jgi:hypothetical protein
VVREIPLGSICEAFLSSRLLKIFELWSPLSRFLSGSLGRKQYSKEINLKSQLFFLLDWMYAKESVCMKKRMLPRATSEKK